MGVAWDGHSDEWSFADARGASRAARMLRSSGRQDSPQDRLYCASRHADASRILWSASSKAGVLHVTLRPFRGSWDDVDPRVTDEVLPRLQYVLERELAAVGGRLRLPAPGSRGLARERLDELRRAGREVWVVADVLHDVPRLLDDGHPGRWAARLEGLGLDVALSGTFRDLDAGEGSYGGRVSNGLLRLTPDGSPPPLRGGHVIERLPA